MKLWNWILELIFPGKCPFCGRVLNKGEEGMCERCQPVLPWTQGKNTDVEFCDASLSPLRYDDRVRRAIHRFKFYKGEIHGEVLGRLMAQCLHDRWEEPLDGVTWVPLSPKRLRERGYDQAELLARVVAEQAGLPLVSALEKVRDTKVQSRIGESAARRANVLGAYDVRADSDVRGKRLVLVDDVVTSGATLSECAACLRIAGAESVVALTCARAGK